MNGWQTIRCGCGASIGTRSCPLEQDGTEAMETCLCCEVKEITGRLLSTFERTAQELRREFNGERGEGSGGDRVGDLDAADPDDRLA